MKIELTKTYRLPANCPKTFYIVENIRCGYVVSRWTNLTEAQAACKVGYHVVAMYL